MKPGTVIKLALLLLLCVFLFKPELFQPVFEPFTRNNAPAIYTQNSLVALTVNHLLLVL